MILECPPHGAQPQVFTLAFQTLPQFHLKIGSSIGHSTKLVNVIKVSDFLQHIIRQTLNNELVGPNGIRFTLENGKFEFLGPIRARGPRFASIRELAASRELNNSGDALLMKKMSGSGDISPPTSPPLVVGGTTIHNKKTMEPTESKYLGADLRYRTFSVYSES